MKTNTKLKTFTVSDVSTGHISSKDDDILLLASCKKRDDYPIEVLSYEYGYFIGVWAWNANVGCTAEERKDIEAKLKSAGHTPAFINLLRLAGRQGDKWLCLDADGEDYDFLPEHDWT